MKALFNSRLRLVFLLLLLPGMAAMLSGCEPAGPKTGAEHLAKAKAYQDKGDLRAGIIELNEALNLDPDNAEARRLRGEINAKLGSGAAAEKDLIRAIELGVSKESVLLLLAESLQLQRKNQEILYEIEVPSGLAPGERARLCVYRGDALRGLDKPEEAMAEYDKALALDANLAPAKLGLANLALRRGDLDLAQKLVTEVLQSQPEEAKVWVLQGDMHMLRNEPEKAEASYSKALAISGSNLIARLDRALVWIALGKANKASEDIDIARKQAPRFFLTRYAEGRLALASKEYANAQAALEDSLNQNPAYLPTSYALGMAHLMQDHLEQAEQYLKQYMIAEPKRVQARRLMALVRFRQGNLWGAKEALLPVVENFPKDFQSLQLMGKIEAGLGNQAVSRKYLDKAAELERVLKGGPASAESPGGFPEQLP